LPHAPLRIALRRGVYRSNKVQGHEPANEQFLSNTYAVKHAD